MLGSSNTLDTRLVQGVFLSLIQLPREEPSGKGGSRQCGPGGYSNPGPHSG